MKLNPIKQHGLQIYDIDKAEIPQPEGIEINSIWLPENYVFLYFDMAIVP